MQNKVVVVNMAEDCGEYLYVLEELAICKIPASRMLVTILSFFVNTSIEEIANTIDKWVSDTDVIQNNEYFRDTFRDLTVAFMSNIKTKLTTDGIIDEYSNYFVFEVSARHDLYLFVS